MGPNGFLPLGLFVQIHFESALAG